MIRLAPLPAADKARVLHLQLESWQGGFVRPIADMVAEATDGVDQHLIERAAEVVGFFKTDLTYARKHEFARPGEMGLRGFLIGAQYQNQGLGKAALAALPDYLQAQYPDQASVVLTVNCKNPAALRAYSTGGFSDTGKLYMGGNSGPQRIFRLELS